MTNSAIFFHPDAVETKGKDIVGRRSAGQSFLRGYLKHLPHDTIQVVVSNRADGQVFDAAVRALGDTRKIEVASLQGGQDFTRFGTVFFPAPGFQNAPWLRQRFGQSSCSLVGITHTVSTRRVIEGLHSLMLDPVYDWDAIICTSNAVHDVVRQQFHHEAEFAKQRFGATRVPQPQLPKIPLGIHAADFTTSDAARVSMRDRFGVEDDDCVIMTMGRLTSVEKANPVPLFMALEIQAQKSQQPLHLWMVGWAARPAEQDLHEAAAKRYCPSIKVRFIDGREQDIRRDIWSGADIFTLPVDNVQETFGLVPVEAMAAGLPVVIPDWNGFKDTILDGVTGFLVPTRMTAGGQPLGQSLARRFMDGSDGYLQHLSVIQQQTVIDIEAYQQALGVLIEDRDLRKKMGAAGRQHVLINFDWSVVIPQYFALADALEQHRSRALIEPNKAIPIEIDPFSLYASYPTNALHPSDVVTHSVRLSPKELAILDALNGRALYRRRLLADAKMVTISDLIAAQGAITVQALSDESQMTVDLVGAAALFLAKYGFVSITSQLTK